VLPGTTTPVCTQNVESAERLVVVSGTETSSIVGRYTFAVADWSVNPEAEAPTVTPPVIPSIPWREKLTSVAPLAMGRSTKSVPAVAISRDTFSTCGLLL
jgi:hypothetical protein